MYDLASRARVGKPAALAGYWHLSLRDGGLLSVVANAPVQIRTVSPPGPPRVFAKPTGDVTAGGARRGPRGFVLTGESIAKKDTQVAVKLWHLGKRAP